MTLWWARVRGWLRPGPLSAAGRTEAWLLALAAAFLLVNVSALGVVRGHQWQDWLMLAAWGGLSLVAVTVLDRTLPTRDPLLLPLALFLCGWGLVTIDRLSENYIYNFAYRQTLWLVLGVAAALVVASRPEPLRWLRQYRYVLLTFGLVVLGSTIVFGTNPSQDPFAPQLWLGAAGVYFQPSELLKVVLVAFLASYLGEQVPLLRAAGLQPPGRLALSPRLVGPVLLMWTLCVVVLVWQRDLGTAMLFFVVFLLLLYVASGSGWVVAGGLVLALAASVVAYFLFDVVALRVDIWLNPWPEADSRAFQVVQSLLAVAAGGVFGRGVGQGAPEFIPVVHSDFVFAAIAEEWGLLGAMVVLAALLVLVARGLNIAARHTERPFYALMAVGLSALLAVQTLLIVGGVLKVLPLTGVTLPFVSYGGSSLLICLVMLGLLLRLSAETNGDAP